MLKNCILFYWWYQKKQRLIYQGNAYFVTIASGNMKSIDHSCKSPCIGNISFSRIQLYVKEGLDYAKSTRPETSKLR